MTIVLFKTLNSVFPSYDVCDYKLFLTAPLAHKSGSRIDVNC